MTKLLSFINKLAATYSHRHMVRFDLPCSVVSFAFDDFPASASKNGGAILRQHNLRGTYYVSAATCGTQSPSGAIASEEDVVECLQQAHELGCHTYDHLHALSHSSAQIAASMQNNQEIVRSKFSRELKHFAYPYGSITPTVKKLAMAYYDSARTTISGINKGNIDLGMLKACSLYSRHGEQSWRHHLHQLTQQKGWLILYTHDVSEPPSHYGCTPQELETVVVQALAMGYDVLPVGEVIKRLKRT